MLLHEFFNMLENASNEESKKWFYLRAVGENTRKDVANFSNQFPNLSDDFELPVGIYPTEKFFSSVFRVSSPGCRLWTHYDVSIFS